MAKKLVTIIQDINKNQSDLSKLRKIRIHVNAENFLNKVTEIKIFENFELGTIGGGIDG